MSVDYSNYREWREEELRTEEIPLDAYGEYSVEKLTSIFKGLLEKAVNAGLENCFLKFESRYEPHEDWLGEPVVFPCGYRRLNKIEKKELEEQDYLEKLAKERGISVYQAKNLLSLVKQGVIKL